MTEVELRVWVPAGTVELVLEDSRRVMERRGDYVYATLPPHTDYALSVNGGPPRPDPCSAWQPRGVHAASRTFDAAAFEWTDSDFSGVAAVGAPTYELHIGTFTPAGTLDSAIEKLDHLKDLGIQMVELMPVHAFPGERGWGYDGVGMYAVQHSYGGPAALQRFVDAAHRRGIGVCLDVVYNHVGPSGNYLAEFAPYFTARHMTPWGEGFDLDGPNSRHVRDFVIENALRWLRDFHIDALRLDAVHAITDRSPRHILAELSDRVAALSEELGRPLSLVAESDLNDVTVIRPTAAGGLGLSGQWADDVHHALHAYLTGDSFGYYQDFAAPGVLAKVLRQVFLHQGVWSAFRGTNWGAPVPEDLDRRRFTVFSANHDQIGNRAMGDRPEARLNPGTIAAGAALLLLSPLTPMIFQGQEWGTATPFRFFTDHGPDIGPLMSAGRRAEFATHGWEASSGETSEIPDPQDPATFLSSKLDWEELSGPPAQEMLEWYTRLLRIRRDVFGDGSLLQHVSADEGDGWFRMQRGGVEVLAAPFNSGANFSGVGGTLVAEWGGIQHGNEPGEFVLEPFSVAVFVA